MYSILFLAITSFITCFFLTPLVRQWSRFNGLLDQPNPKRNVHTSPIPRTGGIAIVVSYLASIGLLLAIPLNGAASVNLPLALHLLPAVGVIFATGLVDDLVRLNAWQKLVGQVTAAYLAYEAGIQVLGVGGVVAPAWLTLPLTMLWLIGCSNALNLIDGVDGLAAGIGLFATFTSLAAALVHGNPPLALATAPLVGALLAFLRYNFNPASIFLGDCGSLTIGFLLGCFGTIWSQKSATLLGMTAPLMALSVPLLDTGMSVIRRFLRLQPIFSPDLNHLHHRLLDRGLTPRQVAIVVYAVCGLAAAFSLLETWPHNRFAGLLLVVFCVAVWIGVRLVGYIEFDEAHHLVLAGTFRRILDARLVVNNFERKVARAVTPEDYWEVVRDVSRESGCADVRMNVVGKVYEERHEECDLRGCCTIRVPLSDGDSVSFRYRVGSSVRQTVAISSIAPILQRTIAAQKPNFQRFRAPDNADASRSTRVMSRGKQHSKEHAVLS